MNDLPLNALRAFAFAHAHTGVRAAARELGVAHSAISRHLAELESWLGVPLREPGSARSAWTLTPQGEVLAKAVQTGLQEITAAVAAIREARSPFVVSISAAPSVAARWLLPRLPALERAHPRIEISLLVNQRLEDPRAAGVDIALRMGAGPWAGVQCEPLMDDALYPVLSPSLWKEHGRPADPRGLSGLRLLHDRDPRASWDAWRRRFGPPSLPLRGPRFASSDLLLRAAEQGQGVALAQHRLAADALAEGRLVRPFGQLEIALANAYWIVRSPSTQAPRHAVATLIAWLREQARY